MLDGGLILLLPLPALLDINLARSLIVAIVVFAKEQLGQTDFLFPPGHFGHGTSGGAGEEVGFEGGEVFVLAAFAALDRVFEVDEEGEVGDSAVVVAFGADYFEAAVLCGVGLGG
jgi:hypothetical protein